MKKLLLLVAILFVTALAGCIPNPIDDPDIPVCTGDQVLVNNQCVTPNPDPECEDDQVLVNGVCEDIPEKIYGDVSFLGVDAEEEMPEVVYEEDQITASMSNIYLSTSYTAFNLDRFSRVGLRQMAETTILNVQYDGYFTLIIDIDNPDANSILDIKVKDNISGEQFTYQPGSKRDLNGNGELDDIFYVNSDITKIYLGIKIPDSYLDGDVLSYSVVDITYLEDGVLTYTVMDPEVDPSVTVNVNILNMIFDVALDKTVYFNDDQKRVYDDVIVSLSVYDEIGYEYTHLMIKINGGEVIEIPYEEFFNRPDYWITETIVYEENCPVDYEVDCRVLHFRFTSEELFYWVGPSVYTETENSASDLVRDRDISLEVVGLKGINMPKYTSVDSSVVPASAIHRKILAGPDSTFSMNLEVNVIVEDYNNFKFDWTASGVTGVSDIDIIVVDISEYELSSVFYLNHYEDVFHPDYTNVYTFTEGTSGYLNDVPLGTYQYAIYFIDAETGRLLGETEEVLDSYFEKLSPASEINIDSLPSPIVSVDENGNVVLNWEQYVSVATLTTIGFGYILPNGVEYYDGFIFPSEEETYIYSFNTDNYQTGSQVFIKLYFQEFDTPIRINITDLINLD